MQAKLPLFAALIASLLFTTGLAAQNAPNWTKEEKADPLREVKYLQFSLDGSFLTSPKSLGAGAKPTLILRCMPGSFVHGRAHGKFMDGHIYVGAVVDTRSDSSGTSVPVQFRLDDGKLQSASWSHSTDYSSIFFEEIDLNTLFYGHFMFHKENTSPQVKKIVIGIDEYLGGEVVMQFQLPDSSEVAEACGVTWYK
jgi:hypothetical protein